MTARRRDRPIPSPKEATDGVKVVHPAEDVPPSNFAKMKDDGEGRARTMTWWWTQISESVHSVANLVFWMSSAGDESCAESTAISKEQLEKDLTLGVKKFGGGIVWPLEEV